MKIIIAIIILGVTITIHELGHFLSAKLLKIRVLEFAVGFGPALFKKEKGETLYSLRLLPLGGYCSFDDPGTAEEDSRAFSNVKIWKQIVVLIAGAVMNLILGFILVVIMVSTGGNYSTTKISAFYDNAPSQASGLMIDDEIKKVNGMSIYVDTDIVFQLMNDDDGIVSMVVKRNGKDVALDNVTFKTIPADDGTKQQISIDFMVYPGKPSLLTVIPQSFKKTVSIGRIVWISFIGLLNGTYGVNELSGPVGVVEAVGTAASYGIGPLLNLVALISINLGIFNLLPLPALDGGRIVFRIIEGFTKKKIKPEVEGTIHFVGIALFLLLSIFITFNDVTRLFNR